jgi:hypothetical protein
MSTHAENFTLMALIGIQSAIFVPLLERCYQLTEPGGLMMLGIIIAIVASLIEMFFIRLFFFR